MDKIAAKIIRTTKNADKRAELERRHIPKRDLESRSQRITRIGAKLTARWEKQRFVPEEPRPQSLSTAQPQKNNRVLERRSKTAPLRRKPRPENPKVRRLIAYDLETTRIQKGTPRPLYITAYGDDGFFVSAPVKSIEHLCSILVADFLKPELSGVRYVAWNGNNFDVFFIAAALLHSDAYIIRPYLTRSKNLRGLKIIDRASDGKLSWEFLDGHAMTSGGTPMKLDKFLEVFAPQYRKLQAPDWETENFNAKNPDHRRYAERDSEGLYYAMQEAQRITLEHFRTPLQPTVGNMGIKILTAHLPEDVEIYEPPYSALQVIRDTVMRGGFCFCNRKYAGPVWKYDINQAYAAAMREAWLPAGRCIHTRRYVEKAHCGIYRITARNEKSTVPFYYRDLASGKSVFGIGEIAETWITSLELSQLIAEKWSVVIHEGYFWEDGFRLKDYVDKLENLRMHGPGGPKGAQGTMMKSIGNNSYGKTVEKLDGVELILSNEKPEGYTDYQGPEETFRHVWARFTRPQVREYHQPQLGAFITAHVRMVLRRAILQAPDAWLYADTDCAMFSRPVTLDIDPGRYGAWKIEAEGALYRIITKKVYANFGATEKHCKGLNVSRLTDADFAAWFDGTPPEQKMVHRNNFLKSMTGHDMFIDRVRVGERKTTRSKGIEKRA